MNQEIIDSVNLIYDNNDMYNPVREQERDTALHLLEKIDGIINSLLFSTGYWCGYSEGKNQKDKSKFSLYRKSVPIELSWVCINGCMELRLHPKINRWSVDSYLADKLTIKFNRQLSNLSLSFFKILSSYVNNRITSTIEECKIVRSIELCEACNGYRIIGTVNEHYICEQCINKSKEKSKDRSGYVYFYGSVYHRVVKIGCSVNPKLRIVAFKNKYPFDMKLILTIQASDKLGLEKHYHDKFSDKQIDGEWFSLNENDIEAVKNDTTIDK